jgi:hypothetical protein
MGGSVTVDGVTQLGSNTVVPLVTVLALGDDSQVIFSTASSTFHTLASQADNGVVLGVDVSSTIGSMYLDGDVENSSSEDA